VNGARTLPRSVGRLSRLQNLSLRGKLEQLPRGPKVANLEAKRGDIIRALDVIVSGGPTPSCVAGSLPADGTLTVAKECVYG
jgi:hypothetical protein